MSQVAKSASTLERAFLAILVLEAMVVRLVRPLKLVGVHGDRWTVRLVFQLTSGVPLGACGSFARLMLMRHYSFRRKKLNYQWGEMSPKQVRGVKTKTGVT